MGTELSASPSATLSAENRSVQRVVILGANGSMGYQSGALFTSAGLEVTFLARTREETNQRSHKNRTLSVRSLDFRGDMGDMRSVRTSV